MEASMVYKTPIGALRIVANDGGICAVKWLFGKHSTADNCKEKPQDGSSQAGQHLKACQRWLDAYFDGSLLTADPAIPKPPLVFQEKGPFYNNVWDALLSSGVGETLTYKELAHRSGNPSAARAAGNAVKSHCLPILVPCHRVVKSTGKRATSKAKSGDCEGVPYEVGQYSGGEGTETKQWLLQHEQDMVKKAK